MKKLLLVLFIILTMLPISFSQKKSEIEVTENPTTTNKITNDSEVDPSDGSVYLRFKFKKGTKFRIVSNVNQSVYENESFIQNSITLNKISFEIIDAANDGSWGLLKGKYETSEKKQFIKSLLIESQYFSEFKRDANGVFTIDPKFFMPTVRDVPTLPDVPIKSGDSWSAPATEVQDFRYPLNIKEPYSIPLDVIYIYVGETKWKDKKVSLIQAEYQVYYSPQAPKTYTDRYPIKISGYSKQNIYFDKDLGQAIAYEENFDFNYDYSDGRNQHFVGKANSEVIEALNMNKGDIKKEVEKVTKNIPNVTVKETKDGVSISLEKIQFEPDKAVLLKSEANKIDLIAQILKKFPDRDILVSGHAASAGIERLRLPLSVERARAVADRLIDLGVKKQEQIRIVGYGDTRPIASNATEEGREKNRRVEIEILEN